MKHRRLLVPAEKIAITSLLIAALGVVIEIISGFPYPPVPPVLFLLLVPAFLIRVGRWKWALLLTAAVGIFLTAGLFLSGAWVRLYSFKNIGGPLGLWIQTIAEAVAAVMAVVAFLKLSGKEMPSAENTRNTQ